VKYVKHWRDPSLDINPYSKVFQYKVSAYAFEKEVRVILDVMPPKDFGNAENAEAFLVPFQPASFVRSVVVSPEAPEWFVELVSDVTKLYGINASVKRSMLAFDPI